MHGSLVKLTGRPPAGERGQRLDEAAGLPASSESRPGVNDPA